MKRRDFLSRLSAAVPAVSLFGLTVRSRDGISAEEALQPKEGWRTFEITTSVDLTSPVGKTRLWVPIPLTGSTDYQRPLGPVKWEAPGATRAGIVNAPGYDVAMLYVEWSDPTVVGPVILKSRVATRDRRVDVNDPDSSRGPFEAPDVLETYLRPTSLLPTDGLVKQIAEKITRGARRDIGKAHALYEWVVDNTRYDPKTSGCGLGDVAAMLESNNLGGKSADINGLFVAMCRSVQVPARDAYGIRVADSRRGFRSLGKGGDISKAQHCRAEFYAKGFGWVPVDPADVRKLVLEEVPGGLLIGDPKVQAARATLFGGWEMNWVAYNHGHHVALPGSPGRPLPYLMYPNGETSEGRLNSLDSAAFRYQIRSREEI
jgi:transglutaminase-like putative cysteine protease